VQYIGTDWLDHLLPLRTARSPPRNQASAVDEPCFERGAHVTLGRAAASAARMRRPQERASVALDHAQVRVKPRRVDVSRRLLTGPLEPLATRSCPKWNESPAARAANLITVAGLPFQGCAYNREKFPWWLAAPTGPIKVVGKARRYESMGRSPRSSMHRTGPGRSGYRPIKFQIHLHSARVLPRGAVGDVHHRNCDQHRGTQR
jgi:hypothetical protein